VFTKIAHVTKVSTRLGKYEKDITLKVKERNEKTKTTKKIHK